MASSSQAATSNGGDVSGAVDEDEVAMWIRLLQVGMDIKAGGTQENEEIATLCRASVATRELGIKSFTLVKEWVATLLDLEISNALKLIENIQANSRLFGPQKLFLLTCLFVFDRKREVETRFLNLLWGYSNGISDADLLLFLSKLAEHYSPSHEVENLEEFLLTIEERSTFLNDCSTLDKATRLAKELNEFSLCETQGPKPHYWTLRDHTLHSVSSFSESVKPLELIFPFSARFETAKECLDRLDLLKRVTENLSPDESDTLASVLSTFKSPEFQALHALKKEMELHREVALQLEQLNGKHLLAYDELSTDQHERRDEEEKRNVVQEALYKKVKCLASIKKANISRQVKLSSEDIWKDLLQKFGSALKEVEGKLKKAQSSEEVCSKECALCYSKFSKKRKRACLDPCGHVSACIACATKAWAKNPSCPWCKASIQKPFAIPAQIFL